jgi:hypothetical protein
VNLSTEQMTVIRSRYKEIKQWVDECRFKTVIIDRWDMLGILQGLFRLSMSQFPDDVIFESVVMTTDGKHAVLLVHGSFDMALPGAEPPNIENPLFESIPAANREQPEISLEDIEKKRELIGVSVPTVVPWPIAPPVPQIPPSQRDEQLPEWHPKEDVKLPPISHFASRGRRGNE